MEKHLLYNIKWGKKKKQNTKLNLDHHCNYVKMWAHESRHRERGMHVTSCFNCCLCLLKISFNLMCIFPCPAYSLQPLGSAQVFPYRGLLYPQGEDREGLQGESARNKVCRAGLLVKNWKGLWIELNWSKPSLSLFSLGHFCSQLLVPLLELFAPLTFSSSGHLHVSLASLLWPLYWEVSGVSFIWEASTIHSPL